MTENVPPTPPSDASPASPPRPRKAFAAWAFVLALAGFYFCEVPVAWVASLVLATIALVRSGRQPQLHGGRGLAVFAILLGVLGLGLRVAWYPGMMAAGDAESEEMSARAEAHFIELVKAQERFRAGNGGRYGNAEELLAREMFSSNEARSGTFSILPDSARAHSKTFKLALALAPDASSFVLTATPEVGYLRSFYYSSQDRAVRSRKGGPAEATDPVVTTYP